MFGQKNCFSRAQLPAEFTLPLDLPADNAIRWRTIVFTSNKGHHLAALSRAAPFCDKPQKSSMSSADLRFVHFVVSKKRFRDWCRRKSAFSENGELLGFQISKSNEKRPTCKNTLHFLLEEKGCFSGPFFFYDTQSWSQLRFFKPHAPRCKRVAYLSDAAAIIIIVVVVDSEEEEHTQFAIGKHSSPVKNQHGVFNADKRPCWSVIIHSLFCVSTKGPEIHGEWSPH